MNPTEQTGVWGVDRDRGEELSDVAALQGVMYVVEVEAVLSVCVYSHCDADLSRGAAIGQDGMTLTYS